MSGALSSPGFDPAIALQAGRGVAPPNPLQTIGQFAQIQNAINQNTAFPGQMELQQQRIAGGKADLLQTWKQASARQLAPLLAEGANPTLADATSTLARLESMGISTHEPLAALSSMSDGPNFRNQLGSWISANLATPGNEVSSVVGTPHEQVTEQGTTSGITRPGFAGGGFVGGSFTQQQPGPSTLRQLREVTIDQGNYQQYGLTEADIGKVIRVPEGAFPYRGTEGPPSITYPGGNAPSGGGSAGPQSLSDIHPTLASVQAPGGAKFTVSAGAAPQFQGLVRDLEAAGYKIDPSQSGGYNPRNIAGTNIPSQHASGLAIDINSARNQQGAKTASDIPPDLARSLAAKWGLRWGGDFSGNSRDPMHFEVAPSAQAPVAGRTQLASNNPLLGPITDVSPPGLTRVAGPPSAGPGGGPNPAIIRDNATTSSLPTGDVQNIEQNRQAYRNAQTQVAPMALNNTQFKEAHDAIANLAQHDITTGAGQAALNQARRVLNQLGYPNSDTVNNAATAEKLLNAAIAAKAPRSDAQQSLAEHANPTLNMPAGASLPIIRQLVAGNRAMQLAVETAPDKQGNGFIAHNTEKSRIYNSPEGLAALSYDMTPGPQRDAYVANLKKQRDGGNPGPWNRFAETFKAAHESKVLAP
jgi:hypothetical protein